MWVEEGEMEGIESLSHVPKLFVVYCLTLSDVPETKSWSFRIVSVKVRGVLKETSPVQ